jgi:hypothetical protein
MTDLGPLSLQQPPEFSPNALPDHPIRRRTWYQLFDRMWRPALGWVACPVAVLYAAVIAPAMGTPLSEGYLVQVFLFAGGIYGVKTFEKVKQVA